MKYQITSTGQIILADLDFMIAHHPGDFTEVVEVETPPEDPCKWLLDAGPWKDRFDRYGYAGLKGLVLALGRTNDVCYAANADLVGRKYVDLLNRRTELLDVLAKIATAVAAAGYPEFTLAMRETMVGTPAEPKENEALCKDYFS
jgi:hypothetical protein